jgi:hypothetical protein
MLFCAYMLLLSAFSCAVHCLMLAAQGGQQNVRQYYDVDGKRRCIGTRLLRSTQWWTRLHACWGVTRRHIEGGCAVAMRESAFLRQTVVARSYPDQFGAAVAQLAHERLQSFQAPARTTDEGSDCSVLEAFLATPLRGEDVWQDVRCPVFTHGALTLLHLSFCTLAGLI